MAKTPSESARKKKPASKAKVTPKAKATATTGGGVSASKHGSKAKTPRTQKKTKTKSPKSTTTPGQDHPIITSSETILHGADDNVGKTNTTTATTATNDKSNSSRRVFYSHIQYIPRCNTFMKSDPMTPPTFLHQTNNNNGNEDAITWRIAIGDLVCIEDPSKTTDGDVTSYPPGPTKFVFKAPFTVGWRHGQILSFFKERVRPKKLSTKLHWGPLKMEVRWFYRHNDLDDRNRRYEKELFDAKNKKQKQKQKKGGIASSSSIKKKTKKRDRGEVFETGHVAVLDASLLLGRLVLKQRDGKMSANDSPLEYPVPTVVNYCYRYYLHAEKDILELYGRENSLLLRGLEFSKMLQQHASARKAAHRFLFLSPPRNNDLGILDESLISVPPSIENIRYADQKVFDYYPHCTLTYPWSHLSHRNLLCPRDVRDSFPKWQLCVGDIVAVPCEESTPASDADVVPGRDQWYPYLVRWSHCQIMSIFRQVENDDSKQDGSFPASSLSCEIRWFPRVAEAQPMCGQKKRVIERLQNISKDEERTSEEIFEGKQVSIIDCGSLLGPVFVDERSLTSHDDDNDDKNPVSPFLIQNRRTVSNHIVCNEAGVPHVMQWGFDLVPAERVHRGLDALRRLKSEKKKRNNQEAVLQSRKERAERIRNERRAREIEDEMFGEEGAGVEVSSVLAASLGVEGSSHGKRELFGVDFSVEKGGSKRPLSTTHGVPVEMGKQDGTMLETVDMSDFPQNNAKNKEQPIILHKTRVSCPDPFHVDVSALKSFYEDIDIIPPFDSYDNRFPAGKSAKMRRGQWKVKLGDTVTITYEDDAGDSSATHFPFMVRWAPAEIISIYRSHKTKESCERLREKLPKGDAQNGNDADEVMVEIRWLYRRDEVSGAMKKKLNPADSNELEEVFETDIVELVSAETILSPLRLHDVATLSTGPSTIAGMPCIHYHCSRFWSLGRRSFVPSGSADGRVLRGRKYSAHKAALSKLQQIPPSPAKSTASAKKQRKQPEKAPQGTIQSVAISDRSRKKAKTEEQPIILHKTRVSCSDPFHVDVSAMKSFYKEVDVIPPFDSYDHRFSTRGCSKLERGQWKVKLGDTVTLEVEKTSKDSSAFHFPFLAPWAPAEIISIYRVHKTKESCARLREELSVGNTQQGNNAGEVMVEIRWFYRSHEIPGASRKKSESVFDELEEVFETDQVDICSADSILSPIRLHDVAMPLTASSPIAGVPCIHYHCSRLWSIHRRTFVPSGSCSNRVLRGRMHSAHKAAFNKLQQMLSSSVESIASAYQQREKPWKETFQFAIQQLSLAEAAQDAQENGMSLPCREEERKQITSFLKKAISGLVHSNKDGGVEEDETMNLKSSLFIAGPPGTGKTASVRSIIAELQREQHEGKLPEFNFIALNGMELRHPFDSYVKFWEAVSGTRKERLPAGDAAHELENYFCGDHGEESDESDDDGDSDDDDDERSENEEENEVDFSERPVTVLMLDEIDYLVTKKETLVYNFFDWPLRATTARLVVIGISNTINLPEKMSTRVQSRIGGDRCHFKSYNVQDTQTILKSRLGMLDDHPGHAVFEEDAIKFAARKTANLSGDIRKAFQMCKSAAEKVLEDYSTGKRKLAAGSRPLVKISDVQKGSRDMFTSIVHKAISCSTSFEALLLISLGALKRTREDGSIFVKEILTKIESIADASGEPKYMNANLSFEDVLRMANRLGEAGIIQLNIYSSSPWPWISTHLHTSEILACYRDTKHIKLAEKHLATQRLF